MTMSVTGTRREEWRSHLATVLEVSVDQLSDESSLVDDLNLDSLSMLSLRAWLEQSGVQLDADPSLLTRVGDVLVLLERLPQQGKLSLVINRQGTDGFDAGPAAVQRATTAVPRTASDLAPKLANHALRLTPVTPDHVGFLYGLAALPETGFRWRYRGAPPSTERFTADLWAQVLVQYIVCRRDGEPIGHVVAYSPELAQGHCFLGAVFTAEHTGSGYAAEAVALFVPYLFHTFALRKIYLEIPGFNWPQLKSAAWNLFQIEGILRDHDYYAGRYWDKYLCAIYPPGRE